MNKLLIFVIKMYQKTVSRWLPSRCRFYPSCSQYTVEAVQKYGAARGLWLAARRVWRCHPLNPGGYDPVP